MNEFKTKVSQSSVTQTLQSTREAGNMKFKVSMSKRNRSWLPNKKPMVAVYHPFKLGKQALRG